MKRTFSAVIVAVVVALGGAVVSCSKVADSGSRSESVLVPSSAASASVAPIDQVPVPPAPTTPAASTTGVIGAPVTTPTATPDQEQDRTKTQRTPLPTTKPAEEKPVHARPMTLPTREAEPNKKPSPVGTSQAGRVVRFTCPSGEVPSQVMGGCMCGSEIANPCGPGVRVPDLRVEGKTCLFTCP
ncbi:MAG: hypothetical protein JWM74_4777 [Myxococcaceae bacterium]|nr:hypothetical protein [Myxococcaceae bacterium]